MTRIPTHGEKEEDETATNVKNDCTNMGDLDLSVKTEKK
jgi:hypothetical protein